MSRVYEHNLPNCTLLYTKKKIDGKYCASIRGFKNNHTCKNLVIPEKIDGLVVTEISKDAFHAQRITGVSLPDSVVRIGDSAFANCRILKSIVLPKSLRVIEGGAFNACVSLEKVVFNEGLKDIKARAFYYTALKDKLILPDSLVEIGNYAFGNSDIKSVHLGSNITGIQDSAFLGCVFLEEINLPEGLRYINDSVFINTAIETIVFPDSLIHLGGRVFDDCENLKSIHVGEGLSDFDISYDFAYGCTSLEKITVSPKNKEFQSINGVLYSRKNNALIRVPPLINSNKVKIPRWVTQMSCFCFDSVSNITVAIRSPSIDNIDNCSLDGSNIIMCIPGSEIENWANINCIDTVPISSNLNNFLSDIEEKGKNI